MNNDGCFKFCYNLTVSCTQDDPWVTFRPTLNLQNLHQYKLTVAYGLSCVHVYYIYIYIVYTIIHNTTHIFKGFKFNKTYIFPIYTCIYLSTHTALCFHHYIFYISLNFENTIKIRYIYVLRYVFSLLTFFFNFVHLNIN